MSKLKRYAVPIVGMLVPFLTATAAPAYATFPGGAGRIAFIRQSGGISSIRPDGSGLARLTSGVTDYSPRWSPNGQSLLFRRGVPAQIWVMSADGTGQHALTSDPVDHFSASWSPDGTRIVYAQSVTPNVTQLYTISSGGGPATRLLIDADSDGSPAWSPDGRSIVFTSEDPVTGSIQLKLLDLRSGRARVLLVPSFAVDSPNWSPDGSRIVVTVFALGGYNQAAIRPDGTGYYLITRFRSYPGIPGPDAYAGVWAPSGPPKLAIAFQGTLGSRQIATIGAGMRILAFGDTPDWQPTK